MVYGTSQPMVSNWQACQEVLGSFFSVVKPVFDGKNPKPSSLAGDQSNGSPAEVMLPLRDTSIRRSFRKEEHMSVRVKINGKTFLLSMDEFMKLVYKMTPENPVNVLEFV